MKDCDLIVIGASAGGVTALQKILAQLPADFKTPIAVTQHLPANAVIDLKLIFRTKNGAIPLEAEDKIRLEDGRIYFAPPDYHLLIERDRTLSLSFENPVCFSRPSIDVLFQSAANSLGAKVCGILLTGANEDGAAGLQFIKKCGGYTMVQDPSTAEVPIMPQAALNLFRPDFIGSLDEISNQLAIFTKK